MQWHHLQDVLPVLTLVIGYCGTIATERSRARAERRRLRADAIDAFERDLLLQTQDALYTFSGEIQDFAYTLKGQSDRTYASVTDSTWRATARLELLTTRLASARTRELVSDVIGAGQSITSGTWPDDDAWSPVDHSLLDKSIDELLEREQHVIARLGERLRQLAYQRAA